MIILLRQGKHILMRIRWVWPSIIEFHPESWHLRVRISGTIIDFNWSYTGKLLIKVVAILARILGYVPIIFGNAILSSPCAIVLDVRDINTELLFWDVLRMLTKVYGVNTTHSHVLLAPWVGHHRHVLAIIQRCTSWLQSSIVVLDRHGTFRSTHSKSNPRFDL